MTNSDLPHWIGEAQELEVRPNPPPSALVEYRAAIPENVTLEPTSLKVTGDLVFDDYQCLIVALDTMGKAIQWWRGDAMVYADSEYGDIAAQAEEEGRPSQTLYNWKTVAKAIESSRRRENLSWAHHEAVMGLEPEHQESLWDWCEETIEETGRPRSVAALRKKIEDISYS